MNERPKNTVKTIPAITVMKTTMPSIFRCILLSLLLIGTTTRMNAQRHVDELDRGLVTTIAQNGNGNFISWRVLGEEQYDVTYNLYADNVKIASGLHVSNYVHTAGTANTSYQVSPVVRGVEGDKCTAVKRWNGADKYSYTGFTTGDRKSVV